MERTRLGAVCWILCLQFFAAEAIAVAGWRGAYSFRHNYISDLGALGCGARICSPLHAVMNASFVLQGVLIGAGALLVRRALPRGRSGSVALGMLAAAGLGVFIVGLAPENYAPRWHVFGAGLHLVFCNSGAALIGAALLRRARTAGFVGLAAGLLGLAGLGCLTTHAHFGLGAGGMERVAVYPFTLWLAGMGAWLLGGGAGRRRRQIPSPLVGQG